MLISVIVAAYNVEKYISDCLQSIICQTFNDLEIIVIDDGSTDNTGSIIKTFAEKDKRIRYIFQENKGLSEVRNKGVQLSTGDYVSFVDGDDFLSKFFIESLFKAIRHFNSMIACCTSVDFFDYSADKIRNQINNKELSDMAICIDTTESLHRLCYQKPTITGAVLKLYNRVLFDEVSFPKGKLFEDTATSYKILQKCNRVVLIDKPLYAYRYRNESIMNQSYTKRKLDCIDVSRQLVKDLINDNENLKKAAFCAAFRLNRLVIGQSYKHKEDSELIWSEIIKYRDTVIHDKNAHVHERLLAICSYTGMNSFIICEILFSYIKSFFIYVQLKK